MHIIKSSNLPKQAQQQAYKIFCENRDKPWQFDTFVKSLNHRFSHLVTKDKTVIAFVLISSTLDEAEIEDIAVEQAHQGKGIAKNLLTHICSNLKIHKITNIFLEVANDNKTALSLYTKFSFEQIAIRKAYYYKKDGKRVDAILMKKVL